MPHPDLESPAAGQPDDVDGLLEIGGRGFSMNTWQPGLEGVHGRPVMGQMGREDAQGVGRLLRGAARDGR